MKILLCIIRIIFVPPLLYRTRALSATAIKRYTGAYTRRIIILYLSYTRGIRDFTICRRPVPFAMCAHIPCGLYPLANVLWHNLGISCQDGFRLPGHSPCYSLNGRITYAGVDFYWLHAPATCLYRYFSNHSELINRNYRCLKCIWWCVPGGSQSVDLLHVMMWTFSRKFDHRLNNNRI